MAKYNEEMVEILDSFGNEYDDEIPYADVESFTNDFNEKFDVDYTVRSIASKLRHMGFTVAKKGPAVHKKSYTEAEEAKIKEIAKKDGVWLEDIADALGRDVKSIGGKLISMGIYGIKKRDKKVNDTPKLFTPEDEAIILEMVEKGECFIEDLAEKLGKSVKQVRGKLAGMRIKGVKTRNKKAPKAKIYTDEVIAEIKEELAKGKSLEDIAKARGLNERGMLVTLTRLGVIPKKGKKVFWDDARIAKLAELAASGVTLEEAADALNTTIMVVGKRAKSDGLEFKKEEKGE
jgi:predicted transcriptional regulator